MRLGTSFSCVLLGVLTTCLSSNPTCAGDTQPTARPNILIVLTDDQGYGDLSCQPHSLEAVSTPHIDRLASQGVRCTQAYSNGHVCSPSRAALLTGRYQNRFGYEGNAEAAVGMPTSERLLPAYFREAGYATACFGKWHLGWQAEQHPLNFGFEAFFGFLGGQHDYFDSRVGHSGIGESHGPAAIYDGRQTVAKIKYLTDELTDQAMDFIRQKSAVQPFCVYLAYNANHGPLQAPASYLVQYSNGKRARDKIRAMLHALDDNMGRLLGLLDELQLTENTLVFFTSDNGGLEKASDMWILRGSKGHFFEGGIRVPTVVRWPSGIPAGRQFEHPIVGMDILPTALAAARLKADRQLDGVNLLPFLSGQVEGPPHETLHWQIGNWFAVRQGDWKYVKDRDGEGLFDLSNDIGETTDLREQQPAKAREMVRLHESWSKSQASRLVQTTKANP